VLSRRYKAEVSGVTGEKRAEAVNSIQTPHLTNTMEKAA
jgi:hypothetical protein